MPREDHQILDARRLLIRLCEAEVAFVIVGSMAAVAQGAAYITVDLDICYERSPSNLRRLTEPLADLNPRLRGAPAGLPFVLDEPTLKAGLNFTLISIDIRGIRGDDPSMAEIAEPCHLTIRTGLAGLGGRVAPIRLSRSTIFSTIRSFTPTGNSASSRRALFFRSII